MEEKIKTRNFLSTEWLIITKIFSRVIYIFIIVNVCMLAHVVWRLRWNDHILCLVTIWIDCSGSLYIVYAHKAQALKLIVHKKKLFSLFLNQNICNNICFAREMVLLSTHNICFGWEIRKLIFWYAFLSKGLELSGFTLCPTLMCPL